MKTFLGILCLLSVTACTPHKVDLDLMPIPPEGKRALIPPQKEQMRQVFSTAGDVFWAVRKLKEKELGIDSKNSITFGENSAVTKLANLITEQGCNLRVGNYRNPDHVLGPTTSLLRAPERDFEIELSGEKCEASLDLEVKHFSRKDGIQATIHVDYSTKEEKFVAINNIRSFKFNGTADVSGDGDTNFAKFKGTAYGNGKIVFGQGKPVYFYLNGFGDGVKHFPTLGAGRWVMTIETVFPDFVAMFKQILTYRHSETPERICYINQENVKAEICDHYLETLDGELHRWPLFVQPPLQEKPR